MNKVLEPTAIEALVASRFRFLEEQYGFTREPVEVAGGELAVTFRKPSVRVIVQAEIGSGPWITLVDDGAVADPPGWRRRRFGLNELAAERRRAGLALPDEGGVAEFETALGCQADLLRQIGRAVLQGDFAVLHERRRRHAAALTGGAHGSA